jgi:branched-subunit amino acid transport protein
MMLLGCVEGRPLTRRALRFVPPAVLSALIAWRTKNALLAIAVGMMALWALQVVFPR